jgi:hypothetical protein
MDGELDDKTKDATRLLYCPASWIGADNLFVSYAGEPLPVDAIIKVAPPPPQVPSANDCSGPVDPAPPGADIVTEAMIVKASCRPEGGRLYGLMVGAAVRFRREGWMLTAAELANAAMQASQRITPGKARKGLLKEAQHALDYAAVHVQPMTELERMRDRMTFQLSNCRRRI